MHEEVDCGERHGLVWKYMIPLAECLICGDQDVLAPRHTATALLGAFMFMVPSIIILSGFATPIANMPALVQDLTFINPMRYVLVVIRECFLERPGFAALLPQYAAMAALALCSLAAAGWLFRKRSA